MLTKKDVAIHIKGASDSARILVIAASTEDVDRDGDRIMASGWRLDNFMRNPVVPWAHNYSEPPVAKALSARVENTRLTMKIQFPTAEEYSFADTVFRLYKGGYLSAFSVGFKPLRWNAVERYVGSTKISGRDYLEQELWEVSAVTVPSNPNALTLAKSAGILRGKEFDRLQEERIRLQIREIAEKMIVQRISKIVTATLARRSLDARLHNHGIR